MPANPLYFFSCTPKDPGLGISWLPKSSVVGVLEDKKGGCFLSLREGSSFGVQESTEDILKLVGWDEDGSATA